MHVEQRILHQRNTPLGNFTILPTEVANLPTKTGSGGVAPSTHTLSAGSGGTNKEGVKIKGAKKARILLRIR